MSWVLGLLGAFLGAMVGGGGTEFVGLVAGALIGWLFGSVSRLKRRLAALEKGALAAPAAMREPVPAPAPLPIQPPPEPVPVPGAEPAWGPLEAEPARAVATASKPPPGATVESPSADAPDTVSAWSRAEAPPTEPAKPREPSLPERAVGAIRHWFSEGNVPVKIGMLVLFVGVAALLKYAVDERLLVLPVAVWFALVAALAVVGLIFGWRQREKRRVFGLALQGGAIGVLLLTVFGAFRLYQLLPSGVAFALIAFLVAASAALAILQNALALAVLGFTGGFLAPVLLSTGTGSHVALFTYYAVLNAAVFFVAWIRPWRVLNLVGFAFTFIVGTMWGYRYYRPEHFATVEPFLILFFLFYVGIGVLYVLRQPDIRRPLVDGTLTFGTPLLAFPLQAALLKDNDLGLAFSALAVAVIYGVLFALLRRRTSFRLQGEAFAGLALGFATLAIPLALSAQWTATTWALEGAAVVWLGLRQDRRLAQLAGLVLQLLAGAAWVVGYIDHGHAAKTGEMMVLNGTCLGALLLAFSGFFISLQYERHRPHRVLVWLAFLWGWGWWVVAGLREIDVYLSADDATATVGFTALTVLLAAVLRGALPWPRLGWIVVAGIVLALPLAFMTYDANDGPFERNGWIAWLPFLFVMRYALYRLREPRQRAISVAHVAQLSTLPLLLGLQLNDIAVVHALLPDGWVYLLTIITLLVYVVATWRIPAQITMPLADLFPQYRARWFAPAALALFVWWFLGLGLPGEADPLPYVPVLNPLELAQAAILLVLWLVVRDGAWPWPREHHGVVRGTLLLAAFATVTLATLRTVHHVTGLPWEPGLLDSMVAQTSLTVVWSVIGVSAWIAGSKRRSRPLWLAGAILMGIVLAKLLLVDREHVGDISGIVSFIAVGLLLTVVGYFAPSPPRAAPVEARA